jgi:hypothetical protein
MASKTHDKIVHNLTFLWITTSREPLLRRINLPVSLKIKKCKLRRSHSRWNRGILDHPQEERSGANFFIESILSSYGLDRPTIVLCVSGLQKLNVPFWSHVGHVCSTRCKKLAPASFNFPIALTLR